VQASCEALAGAPTDYYVRRFWITLDELDRGGALGHLGLGSDNYNYRVRELAVNLVGDNVRDCDSVDDVASCRASGFVPYDLIQTGRVALRDHGGRIHTYVLPGGGISVGRALAAERLVTNPIAAIDQGLLEQLWARELGGRPLQGEYELRIHTVDSLQWDNVVDVQIVARVDYWSPYDLVP
jgi:hypothetical protein